MTHDSWRGMKRLRAAADCRQDARHPLVGKMLATFHFRERADGRIKSSAAYTRMGCVLSSGASQLEIGQETLRKMSLIFPRILLPRRIERYGQIQYGCQ